MQSYYFEPGAALPIFSCACSIVKLAAFWRGGNSANVAMNPEGQSVGVGPRSHSATSKDGI
jgi:hypothetical protein